MGKFKRSYPKFASSVEDFAELSKERMIAITKASILDVVENASLQGPSKGSAGKGGRMRVDTGFLRASGRASLSGMPSGPSRPETTEKHAYDDGGAPLNSSVAAAAEALKLGDKYYFGWTADYARHREVFDGFLEGALQHWGRIVTYNTAALKERIKS